MNIFSHFTKTVYVYQLADESGDKRGYPETANFTTKGMLQAMSAQDEALSEGRFAKGFKLFTPIVGINENDKLVIDSVTYEVKGVKTFEHGNQPHLEIFIYEPNS